MMLPQLPTHLVPVDGAISQLEGAYLYFDSGGRAWIHAGTTSRPFANRHNEHYQAACLSKLEHLPSRFYT